MLKPYFRCFMEAGTDEAGRGCLAGPVTAAAVILPEGFRHPMLNDSKKLSAAQREILAPMIRKEALTYAIAHVGPQEIDRINILKASIEAMHRALSQLDPAPEAIAVDGNRFIPFGDVPHECLIKGDGRFLNIAAASVLAKTERDRYMERIHATHPEYQWAKNKGYPTTEHREALARLGPTPYHRKSFRLLPEQLKFQF
ncbi:ribonuclease HII [Robiginitalea sp. M366]|uniref:ribonuclease HII n=1 Tax=Robiginitalea aestuariiviva TaxID=3036903 RepID=UPI00240E4582|nr:ribonuclease HII [Robiginitalea aestuariiviva]MDG1571985.1 ribonuclease HII [Robiginitalea aestuariiviva]